MSIPLPKHLESLTKSELESLCVDCGLCCSASVSIDKSLKVIFPGLECQYLEKKHGGEAGETWCSVYDTRHEVAKTWCRPLPEAISKGILPNACPYVVDMPGYNGPITLTEGQYDTLIPLIVPDIKKHGQPNWVSGDQWSSFVRMEDVIIKSKKSVK